MKLIKFIFLLFPIISFAQGLRGGEMELTVTPNQKVSFDLKIYADEGVDSLLIDWGDGATDTLIGLVTVIPNTNLYVTLFANFHDYDSIGVFEITIQDSFLIDNVINIEDSGSKYLTIKDSVYTHSTSNNQISFLSKHNNISFDNGVLRHPLIPIKITDFEFATYEFIPFTTEGYSLPIADSLSVSSEGLYWDTPTEVGTYAFAIRANEFKEFANDTLKLTTKTRYMMIDVDSSMLVSSKNLVPLESEILVFPNPVQDLIYIDVGNMQSRKPIRLSLMNSLGQVVLQKEISLVANDKIELDVSSVSSGSYYLIFQNEGGIFSKKVIIHR